MISRLWPKAIGAPMGCGPVVREFESLRSPQWASMLKADELDSKSDCARFDSSGVRHNNLGREMGLTGVKAFLKATSGPRFDSERVHHL